MYWDLSNWISWHANGPKKQKKKKWRFQPIFKSFSTGRFRAVTQQFALANCPSSLTKSLMETAGKWPVEKDWQWPRLCRTISIVRWSSLRFLFRFFCTKHEPSRFISVATQPCSEQVHFQHSNLQNNTETKAVTRLTTGIKSSDDSLIILLVEGACWCW